MTNYEGQSPANTALQNRTKDTACRYHVCEVGLLYINLSKALLTILSYYTYRRFYISLVFQEFAESKEAKAVAHIDRVLEKLCEERV